MKTQNLEKLFHETLKDIYYAERKILRALPKMARGAQSAKLKAAFEKHQEETQQQVERLQQVFELMGKPARGKTCPAIDGIIEEGEEALEAYAGSPALDASLIAAAQAVEHYEIARYGSLREWAKDLGHDEAHALLSEILDQEKATNNKLTNLAVTSINTPSATAKAA